MKKLVVLLFAGVTFAATSAMAGTIGSGGVNRTYDGGYKSSQGHTIYIVKCNSGGQDSVYKASNGFWFSGGSNFGSSYKGLSLSSFASKACG